MSYLIRELKPAFERLSEPLVALMEKSGLTPNGVTVAGMLFVAGGSISLYMDEKILSFVLMLLGGLCDALDGSLARRMGKESDFGAFLDSLLDRVSDALPYIAIALSSNDRIVSLLAMFSMLFSYTVSYARARAEGLGYQLKVGLFERTERWSVLLAGVALDLLPLALTIIVAGSFITTLQRAYIFKRLQEE